MDRRPRFYVKPAPDRPGFGVFDRNDDRSGVPFAHRDTEAAANARAAELNEKDSKNA